MILLDFTGSITFIASLPTQEIPPGAPVAKGMIGAVKHPRRVASTGSPGVVFSLDGCQRLAKGADGVAGILIRKRTRLFRALTENDQFLFFYKEQYNDISINCSHYENKKPA